MASAFRDRMLAATKVAQRQQRQIKARIAQLYEECAQDMSREIARYGSDSLTGLRAAVVQKGMREYVRRLWREIESETAAGARISAGLGIEAQASMLDDLLEGLGITGKPTFKSVFGRTQDEAVASVLNGQIYSGKKAALSHRIWNHEALMNGRIEQIIAANVAQGRSAIQLAKDLEAYVQPGAMMPDHWNDLYPIPFSFAVDYNAKRLAVTTLNHAYYQGTLMAARDNPFAEYLHWELSSFHLVYDVCDTYMEHDEGLGLGNFSLGNAPLPHPFCRCTWYIDSSKSLDEIGRELGDWISGGENAKLDRAFGEWKSQSLGLDYKAEEEYNMTETLPAPGRLLERPFSEGKMQPGDRFRFAGKEIIFEGWSETAETIAGKGSKRKIDIVDHLVAECGGRTSDWKKRKCGAYVTIDDMQCEVDIHWFENSVIHQYYGGKVKIDEETGQWYYPV